MSECAFDGCERPQIARDFCTKHYRRWQVHGDPSVCTTSQNIPTPDRFWMKVQKGPSCWQWTAALSDTGYGSFYDSNRRKQCNAHRFSYELTIGPIPEGMDLDHACSNRSCVNPSHLRPVTRKQNMEHRTGVGRNSSTGVLGVVRRKRDGIYVATVGHNGVRHHAGTFKTIEEAGEAVKQLRLSLFTHNDADRRSA